MSIANFNLQFTGDMLVAASDPRFGAWPAFALLNGPAQTALILDASQMVENFCRRSFEASRSVVENFDGTNFPRIWLSVRPVIQVTAITVNTVPLDNTYFNAWIFNKDTGELQRGDGMDDWPFLPWLPSGKLNVQVVYVGGFSDVPGPVQRATVICARFLHEATGLSQLYTSRSLGDYSYSINPAALSMTMPENAAAILAPYVVGGFAFV